VKVGGTTLAADSKTDTLEMIAGAGISLTPDAAADKVTIAHVAPVFRSRVKLAESDTTPSVFGANTVFGGLATFEGEIAHYGDGNFSWMFSINVVVTGSPTITFNVVRRDDNFYLHRSNLDGSNTVLIGQLTGSSSTEQSVTWNATAGNYRLDFIIDGDTGVTVLLLKRWLQQAGIAFLSTPA
jgi:hypothetical protein